MGEIYAQANKRRIDAEADIVYTVHAFKDGDRNKHSYIAGVYSTHASAFEAAMLEARWRKGAYSCEIIRWRVDDGIEGETGWISDSPEIVTPLPVNNVCPFGRGKPDRDDLPSHLHVCT